jgi:hypothetical protein
MDRVQATRIDPTVSLPPAAVYNNFNVQRHLTSRRTLRTLRGEAFSYWQAAVEAA